MKLTVRLLGAKHAISSTTWARALGLCSGAIAARASERRPRFSTKPYNRAKLEWVAYFFG